MDNAREFEGKTLDEAIGEACAYFDLPREKLEIDIVRDAKSGIFGIVGTRKAVIRARRSLVSARIGDILGTHDPAPRQPRTQDAPNGREDADAAQSASAQQPAQAREGRRKPGRGPREQAPGLPPRGRGAGNPPSTRRKPRQETAELPREFGPRFRDDADLDAQDDATAERGVYAPLESFDQDELRSVVYHTAQTLITPIVHDARLVVEIGGGRVAVHIESDEDLGLLIGREGQTLACLQYLAARIVARRMNTPVRIQLDAGDYRERQDEKLRELALMLAERAKATGRVCPTRPLSSYQRRVVHMALQDDPTIQTRSAGDGPLKRVVIQRARTEQ